MDYQYNRHSNEADLWFTPKKRFQQTRRNPKEGLRNVWRTNLSSKLPLTRGLAEARANQVLAAANWLPYFLAADLRQQSNRIIRPVLRQAFLYSGRPCGNS
jgi:hypothetical protein